MNLEKIYLQIKKANFDLDNSALHENPHGTQIFVPGRFNDGPEVPEGFQHIVKGIGKNHGMTDHHVAKALGGWLADEDRVSGSLEDRLQLEPIHVHRFYSKDPTAHANLRDKLLPYIRQALSQDATLGTFRTADSKLAVPHGKIPQLAHDTVRARLPINLDPEDKQNAPYRRLLANLGIISGGVTHFQTPKDNQIQLFNADPKKFEQSQQIINDYLNKYHQGAKANFEVIPTHSYLWHKNDEPKALTASLNNGIIAPIKNLIQILKDKAMIGDIQAKEMLAKMGIDC